MLRLWNTASRSLEVFEPLHPPTVGMYTCGPTVYNPLQLGNWRKYLVDDTMHRTLLFLGYRVQHVTNITDVGHLVGDGDVGDDKIEREATKTGKTAWDIARYYEQSFVDGMQEFGMMKPDVMPRATEHVQEQIALILELEKKGFTYRISDGIYYDTSKFSGYGRLSGQSLEAKKAGARVEENTEKRHPSDFALWKFAPEGVRRQMEWESPWGVGFPGWHIECSAMSVKYLGQPFDLHMGGVDLLPVHHENEIAQSEAAFDKPLARFWVHNEFLLVDGGRMGKSLGNAYTLEDIHTHGYEAMDYRFFCFGAHYRSKLNFTWDALEGAKQARHKLQQVFLSWEAAKEAAPIPEYMTTFREALEDDLNTAKALAVVWEMVKSSATGEEKRATLLAMDEVMGLGVRTWKQETQEVPEEIKRLAEERLQARQNKNWAESDRLRDEMASKGWTIQDEPHGYSIIRTEKSR